MLIRSQDKKNLAPITTDGVLIEEFIEKDGYLYDTKHKETTSGTLILLITGAGKWLGKYSTEAKAIKALDMIQDAYMSNSRHSDYPVFQMPLDEEVKGGGQGE